MTFTTPSKTLVIAAASRHGSTKEIADRLAEGLTEALPDLWRVARVDLTDLRSFDGADAVILGSAVYYGRWLRGAARALDHLRDAPPADLWLFSTGPVSEIESENEQIISADAMADLGEADEHMVFGGKLDKSQLSFAERIVVKAVHARPGDHRQWDVVDAWAQHIAHELGARYAHRT